MADDLQITDGQPQGHRAGAWVVLIMGIAGLGLGIYQWQGSFVSAFKQVGSGFKTPDQVEAERIAGLARATIAARERGVARRTHGPHTDIREQS